MIIKGHPYYQARFQMHRHSKILINCLLKSGYHPYIRSLFHCRRDGLIRRVLLYFKTHVITCSWRSFAIWWNSFPLILNFSVSPKLRSIIFSRLTVSMTTSSSFSYFLAILNRTSWWCLWQFKISVILSKSWSRPWNIKTKGWLGLAEIRQLSKINM